MSSSLKFRLDQVERVLHWRNPQSFVLPLVVNIGDLIEPVRRNLERC